MSSAACFPAPSLLIVACPNTLIWGIRVIPRSSAMALILAISCLVIVPSGQPYQGAMSLRNDPQDSMTA